MPKIPKDDPQSPALEKKGLKLYRGDCLDIMPTLADNSVDLILTDPPYYKVKGEAWDRQWDNPAKFLEWLGTVATQWQRLLRPNGSLYCFASPKMAARVECKLGEWFNIIQRITWRKPPFATKAEMSRKSDLRMFFPASEAIIFAEHHGADNMAKGEAGYGAKCDELRGFIFEPLRAYLAGEWDKSGYGTTGKLDAAWQKMRGTKGGMAGHWFGRVQWALPTADNYHWLRQLFNASCSGGNPQYLQREYKYLRREYEDLRRPFAVTADVPYTDVWTFATVKRYKGKHPCEKPQPLLQHIITASSRENAVVLDTFMGTGSTGLACLQTNRTFIGIEKDTRYFQLAEQRIGKRNIRLKGDTDGNDSQI